MVKVELYYHVGGKNNGIMTIVACKQSQYKQEAEFARSSSPQSEISDFFKVCGKKQRIWKQSLKIVLLTLRTQGTVKTKMFNTLSSKIEKKKKNQNNKSHVTNMIHASSIILPVMHQRIIQIQNTDETGLYKTTTQFSSRALMFADCQ